MVMVNSNVVYHQDPTHDSGSAGGSTTESPQLRAAPLMILEPYNESEALK